MVSLPKSMDLCPRLSPTIHQRGPLDHSSPGLGPQELSQRPRSRPDLGFGSCSGSATARIQGIPMPPFIYFFNFFGRSLYPPLLHRPPPWLVAIFSQVMFTFQCAAGGNFRVCPPTTPVVGSNLFAHNGALPTPPPWSVAIVYRFTGQRGNFIPAFCVFLHSYYLMDFRSVLPSTKATPSKFSNQTNSLHR